MKAKKIIWSEKKKMEWKKRKRNCGVTSFILYAIYYLKEFAYDIYRRFKLIKLNKNVIHEGQLE